METLKINPTPSTPQTELLVMKTPPGNDAPSDEKYDKEMCESVFRALEEEMRTKPYYMVRYVPPSADNKFIPKVSWGYKIDVTDLYLEDEDIEYILSKDKQRFYYVCREETEWFWTVNKEYIYYIMLETHNE